MAKIKNKPEIKDVKIYKKALSQKQIKRIYNKGITKPKPYITIEELEKERYHLKIQCIENSDYHIDYISGLKDLFKVAAKIAKERK